jgi:hypothetical protein
VIVAFARRALKPRSSIASSFDSFDELALEFSGITSGNAKVM